MGPNSCLLKGYKLAQSFYVPESKIFELQEFYRLWSSLRAKQEHASLLQEFREFDQARVDLEENGGFEGQASVNRSTGHESLDSCKLHVILLNVFKLWRKKK